MVRIFVFNDRLRGSCVKACRTVGRENFKERKGEMHLLRTEYAGMIGKYLWVWKAPGLST
jgi:hypothetical protein